MAEQKGNCWHCGHSLGDQDYYRESTCPGCGKCTHVCKNCRFHAPGRSDGCLEPVAERVTDKERSNFCGYFEAVASSADEQQQTSAEDLLKAAEDLFK